MDPEEYAQKYTNMKCQRVQVDGSIVPAIQDEVMEVEHLLAEPRNDQVSVDGVLYFHEENLGKCYDVDLSCGFEFGLRTNIGGSDSYATLNGRADMKLEVLDGLLEDVAIDDLNTTDGLASACEDYLLDFEFADKAVDLCGESLLQSSSSESHSPGLSGSRSGVAGVSESLKAAGAQSEYKNDFLDNRVTCNICGAIRNNPCQTSNGDCICKSLDIQCLLDNDPPSADSILSDEKEKGSVEERQTVALREKRFRKPTQRYIEEFSNLRSKEKVLNATTKNKQLSVTSHHEVHRVRLRALRKIPSKNSNGGISDMTLPELQVCKEHLKNEVRDNDEESFAPESEDEPLTPKGYRKNDRRKHQRMWTLSEVIKLVDGISEYGVGRWTEIKRLLFSSSSHRTPIDLRDKWRNLLRASSALKSNKKESEHNQEHALRPLPITVLRRVRELAKIHPYPRERCSKESCVGEVGSSTLPTRSRHSSSKRNIRRKKCM